MVTTIFPRSYKIWYQYWGQCGLISEVKCSPQSEGFVLGLWWASRVVDNTTMIGIEIFILSWYIWINYEWTKTAKANTDVCRKTALVTAWLHVHILGSGDLFLFGNTCSNHYDVTVRFVTLNSSYTLHQNRQQNIHYYFWAQVKID